jgi:hypothetical protein
LTRVRDGACSSYRQGVRKLISGAVIGGLMLSLLSGCFPIPPSRLDVSGVYEANGARVELNLDGTCQLTNYPTTLDEETREPTRDSSRLDQQCTWRVDRLLYSGAWELVLIPQGLHSLHWIDPIGSGPYVAQYIGDPDSGVLWKLFPTTTN